MDSIEGSVAQYRQGIDEVQQRIDKLTAQVDEARHSGRAVKDLLDRRVMLHTELTDMQYALGRLEAYVQRTADRVWAV